MLLAAFGDTAIIRGELGRLFRWLEERGLTAVVTAAQIRSLQTTLSDIDDEMQRLDDEVTQRQTATEAGRDHLRKQRWSD